MEVDVVDLDVDFYVFLGYKMMVFIGIGVLYGKCELFDVMEFIEFGGEMIDFVELYDLIWKELLWKFEVGILIIGGVIVLGVVIDYLVEVGFVNIYVYE